MNNTNSPAKISIKLKFSGLKRRIYTAILASSEFQQALSKVATNIKRTAKITATEKTVEGCFERELYALLKEVNIDFSPEKEAAIDTRRHIGKGRMDSRIGSVVIEYKRPAAFKTDGQITKATEQLEDYVQAVSSEMDSISIGFLTDGKKLRSVRAIKGTIIAESAIEKLNTTGLLHIIKNLISLDLDKLSPEKLISDFCGVEYKGPIYEAARIFYKALNENISEKTLMLRSEWEEMFKLGHNDLSQQRRIQERKKIIGEIFGDEIKDSRAEYGALFALHTAYALIIKLMAYNVVTEIWFEESGRKEFESRLASDSEALRIFCEGLENGGIFRDLGILNLLEGDFFSWYCDKSQWQSFMAKVIKEFLVILSQYIGTADIVSSLGAVDLFRDLYESTVPQVVRATFGEFYTPYWLAQQVLQTARSTPCRRVLDPCCGSGTFLITGIDRILAENADKSKSELLDIILDNVVGIDLNPLAVLTARVNYFIHIADLFVDEKREFIIPIYLGDASHPPTKEKIKSVVCLSYSVKTMQNPISVTLPIASVKNTTKFLKTMQKYEEAIRSQMFQMAYNIIIAIIQERDRKKEVLERVEVFTKELIELEAKGWNGIWARIITNFFTTAAIGKFNSIVGNPPWIDWKNLPSGYRERLTGLCIDRGLFSGDKRTGGINLNICALISYSSAQRWLSEKGVLAFLMPRELAVQQSYQGWRRIMGHGPFYFKSLHDWSSVGHPFGPTKEDFMTYVVSKEKRKTKTIPVFVYRKNTKGQKAKEWKNIYHALKYIDVAENVAGTVIPNSTALTFAKDIKRLDHFKFVAGECSYIGREGIEYYPQELQLFYFESTIPNTNRVILRNMQTKKSKYKMGVRKTPLETTFLFPLVKGPLIDHFTYNWDGLIVAFPYRDSDPHKPLSQITLQKESPLLLKYYRQNQDMLKAQTDYSDKLRGQDAGEYYGLARTGPYSFADKYVAFRDNTKWCACVVTNAKMPWGDRQRFVFQNHAVSICENRDGEFISEEEAHFICSILNAPVVEEFIYASSDQRSYKIRPPVYVPKFNPNDDRHIKLAKLSMLAHADSTRIDEVRYEIEDIYLSLCREVKKRK